MDDFMECAIEEAKKGLAEGGIPIGSVLVRNGQIVGRGHNMRVQVDDPLAHAEIVCIRNAGRLGNYSDTILYSTLMPCYLCAGAAVQFGIKKVIVGESENFRGGPEFMKQHEIEVTDLGIPECIEMMSRFIKERPDLWYEDIGERI
ncbi:MAG: nucleoside deaminase [Methanomethylovorans sp.]|nr:nucleoside deaminase [Methanomethylovorans sp.]